MTILEIGLCCFVLILFLVCFLHAYSDRMKNIRKIEMNERLSGLSQKSKMETNRERQGFGPGQNT